MTTPVLNDPLRPARRAVQAGRFREAADALDRVATELRATPDWLLLAAMARWRLGQFAAGRDAAIAARAGFRAVGDTDGEMRAENVAAAGAFALGELPEAEGGFTRAWELARHAGDDLLAARCANNIGNVAYYQARHDVALAHYRLAAAGFERMGFAHGLAETWINQAIVARDLNRVREALNAAEQALEVAERAGQPRLVARALVGCGEAIAALGDVEMGRAQVNRGLALTRREEDRLGEAEALRVLCRIARHDGRLDDAERHGREALAIVERLGHSEATAEVQRDLGMLYRDLGRGGDAARAFRAAAELFRRLGALTRAEQMEALATS